jgi:hypothetical protein
VCRLRGKELNVPRFEIVAHVTREFECETATEAAAIVRRQVQAEATAADRLLHLAVWREDAGPAVSPLPPALRQRLVEFFAALERCAEEAEDAFRGRVEAILTGSAAHRTTDEPTRVVTPAES